MYENLFTLITCVVELSAAKLNKNEQKKCLNLVQKLKELQEIDKAKRKWMS